MIKIPTNWTVARAETVLDRESYFAGSTVVCETYRIIGGEWQRIQARVIISILEQAQFRGDLEWMWTYAIRKQCERAEFSIREMVAAA